MIGNWQDLVVLVVVCGAAGYLGLRGWRIAARRGQGACGCGDPCSARDQTAPPVVQIQPLANQRK
ncbi:MAG: hypothetical protein GTO03_08465 [Planctomycetales bacterium]|nr:hypothetical protein [Planctomycetales bacterium]